MKKKDRKIFVLDTSVILYDHSAIECFQEHDVAIPIQVLEELDTFKKGNDTINYEAREFIRHLDQIAKRDVLTRLAYRWTAPSLGRFKVVAKHDLNGVDATKVFARMPRTTTRSSTPRSPSSGSTRTSKVVLVSKDIALRLKAKSLNILSEDFLTGKVRDVREKLYTGRTVVDDHPEESIDKLLRPRAVSPSPNWVWTNPRGTTSSFSSTRRKASWPSTIRAPGMVDRVEKQQRVRHRSTRTPSRRLAMSALLDPEIKLVTLQGAAGTGKTLLALACALEQRREYRQIYVTRPVVPLSNKDIGYLPGDIQSKLDPYMQPLWDNLKLIKGQFEKHDSTPKRIDEMLENEKIAIAPLAYIRGRSLSNIFFIVDEAQNLTPLEMKTVISRAGEGHQDRLHRVMFTRSTRHSWMRRATV
jgi:PhoH-like ATPase